MTAGGGVYMKEVEYRETVDFKGKIEAFTKINTQVLTDYKSNILL